MSTVSGAPTMEHNQGVKMPSEVYDNVRHGAGAGAGAGAHEVSTPPQQGAPEPGSGTAAHEDGKVPFKDQMVGYAKSIRGSVLKQPETKTTGDKILHGEISAKQYFEQKHD